jgi:hypothetical protein
MLFAAIITGTRVYETTPLARFTGRVRAGVVINDRPSYDVHLRQEPDLPARLGFVLRVVGRRAAVFWSLWLDGYSTRHRLINALTLFPLFGAAMLGLWVGLRTPALRPPSLYLALLMVAYTVAHSLTMIDYDLRYRLPVLPALFGLAATLGRQARDQREAGVSP